MRRASVFLVAVVAILVGIWSMGQWSEREGTAVAPTVTPTEASEDGADVVAAAAGGAEPAPEYPPVEQYNPHKDPARRDPPPGDDPFDDPLQELYDEMAALVEAADDCSFPNLSKTLNLEEVDPAAGVRALLEHEVDPEENKHVREAVNTATDELRRLLEDEGCL